MFYETTPVCCILHNSNGPFLPPRLIYRYKTTKSFPQVDSSFLFSLSVNEEHYSNKVKSIIEDIVIPYTMKEKKNFSSQPAMPIIDIFNGQITEKVLKVLQDDKIVLITVLANLTYVFQELDVQRRPNKHFKCFMRKIVSRPSCPSLNGKLLIRSKSFEVIKHKGFTLKMIASTWNAGNCAKRIDRITKYGPIQRRQSSHKK